jgi:hypothetical protein
MNLLLNLFRKLASRGEVRRRSQATKKTRLQLEQLDERAVPGGLVGAFAWTINDSAGAQMGKLIIDGPPDINEPSFGGVYKDYSSGLSVDVNGSLTPIYKLVNVGGHLRQVYTGLDNIQFSGNISEGAGSWYEYESINFTGTYTDPVFANNLLAFQPTLNGTWTENNFGWEGIYWWHWNPTIQEVTTGSYILDQG